MSVPTPASRSTYVGNGVTTVFSTGFYFLDQADVVVKLTPSGGVQVVQTLGVHYTVTMPAAVGGNGSITMLVAPPDLSSLVVERTVPYVQDTSFRTAGSFSAARHEDAMDEVVFQTQQLARRISDLESAGAPGSVVAGNGLAFAGSTLHVGAGNGIQANADTIEVLFGAAADLADVTKAAESAGVGNTAARIDHKHDISTAIAGAIAVGDAVAEGTATSLARSDHRHGLAAPPAPANVDKSGAAAGVAGTVARSDHKHDITTAAAIDLTDAASTEGAAASLARSDHTHAHGARGGGTLHAVATTGAAGFMSAADKTLLDEAQFQINTVQTVDATPTQIATFTPVTGQAETVIVTVTAKDKVAATSGSYRRALLISREAGVTTIRGAITSLWTIEDEALWDVTIAAATPAITVTVTGKAAQNVYWSCVIERRKVVA